MEKVLELDLSECSECEACISVCPQVFRMNEAGFVEIVGDPRYHNDCVQEAIKYCPCQCIYWEDAD